MIAPCHLDEAKEFVRKFHRHHQPPLSHKFSLLAAMTEEDAGKVVGVIVVGRPVSRHQDDGWTLEITRCCTDGTQHAASFLYGRAWRATRALGYRRLITYTLASESGSSLRAVGWKCYEATTREGQGWNVASRPRIDTHPLQRKIRWEVEQDETPARGSVGEGDLNRR